MPVLVLDNVSKNFTAQDGNPVSAVHNLSFTVEQNELLVIVGPSGCGKTTTLRLIAGLESPCSGTISLDGKIVNATPPHQRDVAIVFQQHALFPHLTAFENIGFGLKLRKFQKSEIEKRVRDAAVILGISDKLNRKPDELSGGEAQRVALGRALVRQPKLFLLDEPLSNLDALTRSQLRCEIVRLQQCLNVPMIYVTHDQAEAEKLGHRLAVMAHGQLQQIGTNVELQKAPSNEFVRRFFRESTPTRV